MVCGYDRIAGLPAPGHPCRSGENLGDATNMAAPSAHFSFYSIDDAVTELANPAYFIIGDTEQSIAYDAEIKYDRNFSCVQRKGVNSVLKCCISSFL